MQQTKLSPSPSGEGLGWGRRSGKNPRLLKYASEMRRNPTEPEIRLSRHLSNSQLAGFKFRRQAVIGKRIADFFCPSIGLIVEVDGHTHDRRRDDWIDKIMARHDFRVVRVSNGDVITDMERVCELILSVARSLPKRTNWRLPRPHPNLSPEGEGLS